jgi:outer membrane protein assembly factor BamB
VNVTPRPSSRVPRPALAALIAAVALLAAGCDTVAKPQGWAAPAVRDDVVLTSHAAGKLGAYRWRGGTGQLWEFPRKEDKLDLAGLYGTPVVRDDTVYVGGYGGSVVALNVADGAERWRHRAGDRVVGGVLVTADTVYAGTDAGDLVALNRADGSERWRKQAGNEVWSTPVGDEGAIYVASMDGRVTAFSADGTVRWQERIADGAIAGTPALRDGVLYLGSYDKRLYAVDAASGATRWRSDAADSWFWTEPVIDGDNLYAGNLDGHVYALDRRTGERRWRTDLEAQVRARGALVDGVLVVPAKDGRLWGLRPESGDQAWQAVEVGGRLFADLTQTRDGLFLASEVGKKSHRIYRVNAGAGSVAEVALN